MKKLIIALIVLSLVICNKFEPDSIVCGRQKGAQKVTCQNQGDLSSENVKCCYLLGKKKDDTEFNDCVPIVDDKVDEYKEDYLSKNEVSSISIECGEDSDKSSSSSFLMVVSLALLSLIF